MFKDNTLLVCSMLIKMNKTNFAMCKCLAKINCPIVVSNVSESGILTSQYLDLIKCLC